MANITNEDTRIRQGREMLTDIITQLLAVEMLEYHDKNLLSGDNKTRSEWQQQRLTCCLDILKRFEL